MGKKYCATLLVLLCCSATLCCAFKSHLRNDVGADGQGVEEYASQLVMNSLSIHGNNSTDAVLELVNNLEGTKYDLGLHAESELFSIKNARATVLEANKDEVKLAAKSSHFSSVSFENEFIIGSISQWSMVIAESFQNEPTGWSINAITKCGGIFMLGGYGVVASEKLEKTFEDLPGNHKTIRITGSFHFIDAWSGETAFLQVLDAEQNVFEYVWTQNYDLAKAKNGINVCGSEYPEAQLSANFDVTIPHSSNALSIKFGSTLENDAYENSYGISNLRIYVR